jgi:hypothetical protein
MTFRAGFAEIDITPPPGTRKIGWIKLIVSDHVLDPLHARAAVFEAGETRLGVVQLDVLCVKAALVARIREAIGAAHGFPGENVMVSATHNHAGPAVVRRSAVPCEEGYVETLIVKIAEVFGTALGNLGPAELGFGRRFEFDVAHNRRVRMRDGTTKTHGRFSEPNALCFDGPIDPEVGVVGVRSVDGERMGALVNFACHPTHHGPTGALSAGWPGVLAREVRSRGCPVTLFLQGAAGNVHTSNPATGEDRPMEEAGKRLADDAAAALDAMEFTPEVNLACRSRTIDLPRREPTDEQVRGTAFGAQRFVDPGIYDRLIPELIERYRQSPTEPAEVQLLCFNNVALAAVPAEYFVEYALRIKQAAWPRNALVGACANGMLGYIPTREAFEHGGYETTFGTPSCMAPEAGDLLADAVEELIRFEE